MSKKKGNAKKQRREANSAVVLFPSGKSQAPRGEQWFIVYYWGQDGWCNDSQHESRAKAERAIKDAAYAEARIVDVWLG